jgi:hypothetical protein
MVPMNEIAIPLRDAAAPPVRARRFVLLSEPVPSGGTGGPRIRRWRLASLSAVRRIDAGPGPRAPRDFSHLARSHD